MMRAIFTVSLLALSANAWADDGFEGWDSERFEGVLDLDAPEGPTGIINGEDATEEDWPMTGGMIATGTAEVFGYELTGRLLMCSSTLIAPDVVLLAAHCVDVEGIIAETGLEGIEITDLELAWAPQADLSMFGFGLSDPPPYPDIHAIAWDWVFPDDWNINMMQMGLARNHDIGLMFLEEPVLDRDFAYIITEEEDEQFKLNKEVVVVGWGQQTDDQQAPAGTVGFKKMGTSFIAEKTAAEFKVGELPEDVRKCHGDSGGPTFMEIETESSAKWRIVGVTSHAYDMTDCRETGGVDTRITAYLDWIDSEMRSRCEDGTRSWCQTPGIPSIPDADGVHDWDVDEAEDELYDKKGCACVAAPGPFGALPVLFLSGLLGLRRRE
jgi:hypothetical protein